MGRRDSVRERTGRASPPPEVAKHARTGIELNGGGAGASPRVSKLASPHVMTVNRKHLNAGTRRRHRTHTRQRVSRCLARIGVGGVVLFALAALYMITLLRTTGKIKVGSAESVLALAERRRLRRNTPPPTPTRAAAAASRVGGIDPFNQAEGAVQFHEIEIEEEYEGSGDGINSQGHDIDVGDDDWEEIEEKRAGNRGSFSNDNLRQQMESN